MNSNETTPPDDHVAEEAMRWVVDSDDLSWRERAQFKKWLNQSDEHKTQFEFARSNWKSLEAFEQLRQDAALQREFELMQSRYRSARTRRYALPTAAVLALVAVTLAMFATLPEKLSVQYTTTVGEQQSIVLPDESVVLLNTDTSVTVNYAAAERKVELEYGEAHFEVATDTSRQFIVVAGSGLVRAVGTAFNVQYVDAEAIEVTVTEGEVEVETTHKPSLPGSIAPMAESIEHPATKPTRLTQGHNARITDTVKSFAVIEPEVLERSLAWQQGWLRFVSAPLSEVAAEIDRYTPMTLVVDDPELATHLVTITGKADDIHGLLRLLDESSHVIEVTEMPNGRMLISAADKR